MRDSEDMTASGAVTEDMISADTAAVTVTTAEAAVIAGVSQRTIRRWIQRGFLPAKSDADGYRVSPADLSAARDAATGGHNPVSPADTGRGHGHVPSGQAAMTDDRSVAVVQLQSQIEDRYLATIDGLRHDYEIQLGALRETFEGWLGEKDKVIASKDETIGELRRRAEAAESRLSALEAQSAESPQPQPDAPETQPQRVWWRFW